MAFDQREELKLRSSSVDRPLELVQFPVLGSDRTREIYSAHVPNQLETLHWGKGEREREREDGRNAQSASQVGREEGC